MQSTKIGAVALSTTAVFAGLASMALAAPAEASASETKNRKPIAISIGDSFISGEGGRFAGNTYSKMKSDGANDKGQHNLGWEVYRNQTGGEATGDSVRCHRSTSAEIHAAAAAFGWHAVNLACSGAVTHDVLHDGYRGEKSQLNQLKDYAQNPNNEIKTIVVSIGGNDLGFSDILTEATQVAEYHDAKKEQIFEKKMVHREQYRKAITATLDAITDVMRGAGYADGSYKFVDQSYPSLFAGSNNRYKTTSLMDSVYEESPGVPMSNATVDHSRAYMVPEIAKLIKESRDYAKNKHIQFLDLSNAFAGHEISSKDTKMMVNTKQRPEARTAEWAVPINSNFIAGSKLDTQRQQESYHPNFYGQQAMGTCLVRALQSDASVLICSGQAGHGPEHMKVVEAQ